MFHSSSLCSLLSLTPSPCSFLFCDCLLPFVFSLLSLPASLPPRSFGRLPSSLRAATDLQQEHDRGHLPGSGDPVQRPQRAAGAAHASPPRQGQSPGQRPSGHAHCAPDHLDHSHQHLMRSLRWSALEVALIRARSFILRPPRGLTVSFCLQLCVSYCFFCFSN